jgi:hypothetical protein
VPADVTVDTLNSFTIQPVDIYQNFKHNVSSVMWNVAFSVPGVVSTQSVNADGTTTVTWNTTVAGLIYLTVTCNDGDQVCACVCVCACVRVRLRLTSRVRRSNTRRFRFASIPARTTTRICSARRSDRQARL